MDCLPSMLFTVTGRVSAASHQIIPRIPQHILHDHRQLFQITTPCRPYASRDSHKNYYSCLPIYSDGGSEQPGGRQLRKLKFMSRQVFRSIRFSGDRRENGAKGQRSCTGRAGDDTGMEGAQVHRQHVELPTSHCVAACQLSGPKQADVIA
jgi:hypothetical protein